jgi:hypothetical protein
MKKIISLLAISCIAANIAFAQTYKVKIKTTKPATSFSEVSGIDDHQAKSKTKKIMSPRNQASGKATGKTKRKPRK